MKKVPCSNQSCNQRRIHHERQDEMREQQMVEVKDDYEGKAFCSITCACMAGKFSVRSGWIEKNNEAQNE